MCDFEWFEAKLEEDLKAGLIPFWLTSTLGTTSTCAYDDTTRLNAICAKYGLWHNVDAAYAGVAWVVEAHRKKVKDLEHVIFFFLNII